METKENKNPLEYTAGYWKTLQELGPDANKLIDGEFLSSPLKSEDGKDESSRRDFLKLMAASLALSATACVRRPAQKIVPYAKAPEEVVPGVANYYASSWQYGGEGYGLLVRTREGRPIKLEGNPHHLMNQGGLTARAAAQILGLYSPDRLKAPVAVTRGSGATKDITWDQLDEQVVPKLKDGVVILSSSLASPAAAQLIGDFLQGFKGRHVTWDALGAEDVRRGQEASYGKSVVPRLRFDQAKFILSVDSDFIGTFLNPAENMRGFSKGRTPGKDMNKLVVFESLLSLTGINADFRVKIKPSQQIDVVMGLAHEIAVKMNVSKFAGGGAVRDVLGKFANVAEKLGVEPAVFKEIAKDLWENRGKSLVVAGGPAGRTENAQKLQVAVNFLNNLLENDGRTVDYEHGHVSYQGSTSDLAGLIDDMKAGKVKALIIHRLNAAYLLPKNSGFVEALKNVPTVIYTGATVDETGMLADYVAPDHHDFEVWGDLELQAGLFSIQQPTIRPLYDTRSFQSSLLNWASAAKVGPKRLQDASGWFDYLQGYWKEHYSKFGGGSFDAFWTKFLQDGVATSGNRDAANASRSFNTGALSGVAPSKSEGLELVLYEKAGIGDGSYGNISWMQELPDPVTKVVWDNYALISFGRAKAMGLDPMKDEGKVARLVTEQGTLELPVYILPGVHDDVVGVAVGYGRKFGSISKDVGQNAWQLAEFGKAGLVMSGLKVKSFDKTGGFYQLVGTQGHNYMEGRPIVAEATLADYLKNNRAGVHDEPVFSLWPEHKYTGYRWGMAIDLNLCSGCSACVTACQSENNIPVVGKKYVFTGREMHWIRIDRYFNGDTANPQVVTQPIMCQHCENAPCETVCPVIATNHSSEGLNDMAYNRCVGTRYCANNCPYKVRRFNWFNYSKVDAPLNMAFNPEVGVRSRGVMEKCSMCVQRIHEAKVKVSATGAKIKDGDIQTACQQVCPAQAIVFGDMNDPESKVTKHFKDQRTYLVLKELNTLPSVRYKSKIRNTEKLAATPGHEKAHGEGGHA